MWVYTLLVVGVTSASPPIISIFSDQARYGRANWRKADSLAVTDDNDNTHYVFPSPVEEREAREDWYDDYYYEDDPYYVHSLDNRQDTASINPLAAIIAPLAGLALLAAAAAVAVNPILIELVTITGRKKRGAGLDKDMERNLHQLNVLEKFLAKVPGEKAGTEKLMAQYIGCSGLQVKVQWTEQLVATQQQKTETIKKQTESIKAIADAQRNKAVLEIKIAEKILDKEGDQQISTINNAIVKDKEENTANIEKYKVEKEAEANTKLYTADYVKLNMAKALTTNTKFYFSGENSFLGGILNKILAND